MNLWEKNQKNEVVLKYYRWLMMRKKKNGMIEGFNNVLPELPEKVETKDFEIPLKINYENWDNEITGSNFFMMIIW